jgi:hypothetical protein
VELAALIFGGIGACAGVIALWYAHAAFNDGKQTGGLAGEANDLAKGASSIALDARRIAIVGIFELLSCFVDRIVG